MTDTSARLLSLLSLLQTPREWPGSELAGRLGVSPRTIRRDIERLRDLGYPVQATMGAIGGYRLAAGTPSVVTGGSSVSTGYGTHVVPACGPRRARYLPKTRRRT
jgi:biotin operon repressor